MCRVRSAETIVRSLWLLPHRSLRRFWAGAPRENSPVESCRIFEREHMPRLVRLIWSLLALHLAVGMIAYVHFLVTGRYVVLGWYFSVLGSLFFLLMTGMECCLAVICRSWFDSDEPMRLAWGMIACASFARL